jgi:hypothetical protein
VARENERDAISDARLEWLIAALSADPRLRSVVTPLRGELRAKSQDALSRTLQMLIPRVPPAFRARLAGIVGSTAGRN